jgi:sec-independent protein translocase protein TatB
MFDIGWSELLIIGIVALIVIGPKELPGVLRMAGQWIAKVRRMAADFQGQFQEAMREADMADLKQQVDEIKQQADDLSASFDPLDTVRNEFDDVGKSLDEAGRIPDYSSSAQPNSADTSAATFPPGPAAVSEVEAEPADIAPPRDLTTLRPDAQDDRDAGRPAEKAAAGGVSS